MPSNPYFGQAPPGDSPSVFAPEFFTEELHSCPVFSPDVRSVYWDLMTDDGCILFSTLEGGRWTEPKPVPFASRFGVYDPCFSRDGSRLFFTSSEAIRGGVEDNKENIWYVDRTERGWSERKPLPPVVNSHGLHWQISVARNGNLYFGDNEDILCAKSVDGEYMSVEKAGNSINSVHFEGTPFVAPDESYIIFSRFGGGLRFADLFISFRDSNEAWTPALNMGNVINSSVHELCPQVTPDGKYLFFLQNDSRGELRPMWVDAEIIKHLKPAE
ncbi:MAG: PD40 domain-containing protein [Candidatus Zixiibacteriota bacterium]|nr:MAG: PD40 domain-containing protein [candidate division Zixibacteria bacterium]